MKVRDTLIWIVVLLLTLGITTMAVAQDPPPPPPGKVWVPIWGVEYLGSTDRPEPTWTDFQILQWNKDDGRWETLIIRRNVRPAVTHHHRRIITSWKLVDWSNH